ncbi:MAG TPA: O-antigen ligase family protein [Thermoanaerobaculia bacterium]|nr:O-antigen ligase family protein [Thermoanaerobaculia bacterium]
MEAAKLRTARGPAIPQRTAAAPAGRAVETERTGATSWLTAVVLGGMLLIPFAISHAEDPFRYPKELMLRLEIIVIAIVVAVAWALGRLDLPRINLRAPAVRLTATICAWVAVCALLSTNRLVSAAPTARVLMYAVLFAAMTTILRRRPVWLAGIVIVPAVVNAAIYILQEFEIWSPFVINAEIESHLHRTALIGNPNDVGGYFIVPALVAAAMAFSQRRWRALWAAVALFLVAGVLVTHTVGAIAGVVAAMAVMVALWLRSWRRIAIVFVALAALGVAIVAAYPPLRARAGVMREAAAKRDYETFTSGRTVPFMAAAAMVREHPLTGVGPGCFAYNFFDTKLRLQQRHHWIFLHTTEFNFGEVHNDHLQVASETGLPGYALYLAALALLASASWRRWREAADERGDFVRMLALPLAASMFVLALAQFPLELVSTAHVYLWGAAAVTAWRAKP